MKKQNVTFLMSEPLLKKAKILAVNREKTLNGLFREAIEEKVRGVSGYKKAKERQLRILARGFDLKTGGHIATSREELHARQ